MLRFASVIAVAGLLAACNPAAEEGPVVATPEGPQNEAVATDNGPASTDAAGVDASATEPSGADAEQTAGANSFTETQARERIEAAGYTNVTNLTQTPQGIWEGSGTRDGASVNVSVDFKGVVKTR